MQELPIYATLFANPWISPPFGCMSECDVMAIFVHCGMPVTGFARSLPSASRVWAIGHLPFSTFCTCFKIPCLLDDMHGQLGLVPSCIDNWPTGFGFGLLLCPMCCPLCLVGDKFRCRLNVCPGIQHVTLNCPNHLKPARIILFHLWVVTVG